MNRLKRAVLKEEYVAITENTSRALILNQMIYWSERIRDFDKFIDEEVKRSNNEGRDINIDLTKGWIYKSYDELRNELMISDSIKTISRHLNNLVDCGFLDRRRNPNYRYDRTYQYRVNLLKIRKALNLKGYELQDYRFDFINEIPINNKVAFDNPICQNDNSNSQFDNTKSQFDKSYCHGDKTIPEITTNITTENISEITTTNSKDKEINVDVEENVFQNSNPNILKSKVKNIANEFSKIIGKKSTIKDLNTIKEILNHETVIEIPLEKREEIINTTILREFNNFMKRSPGRKINSFKYFYQSIIDEFENHFEIQNIGDPKGGSCNNMTNNEIEDFFNTAWLKYPKKDGKTQVSLDQKRIIFELGEEFLRAIDRYLKYDTDLILNGGWKELQLGKTFFNSGYIDWTDKEFEAKQQTPVKSKAEKNKERILNFYKNQKEAGLL